MDNLEKGYAHISTTFHNTRITIKDANKNEIFSINARKQGYKYFGAGSIEATKHVAELAALAARYYGIKSVVTYCNGSGIGREAAFQTLVAAGLEISMIKDMTPVPHNGHITSKIK